MNKFEIQQWLHQYPLFKKLISLEEVFWINPKLENFQTGIKKVKFGLEDVLEAQKRLQRFAPYIAKAFQKLKLLMES